MKDLIPGLGTKTTRQRIDEVFSRNMLGSVLLGAAAGKIIEKVLNLMFGTTAGLLAGWTAAFVVFLIVFIHWDRLERAAEGVTE